MLLERLLENQEQINVFEAKRGHGFQQKGTLSCDKDGRSKIRTQMITLAKVKFLEVLTKDVISVIMEKEAQS